ncbi:DNA (cytosine-5-)-methyltransferase [Sulfurovum sp. enrichment culture clone C5]|uniref:DNA (cytosine-5-)-methyltransferase n=1 Tax=Sulfurovum sp. enrichment culture clone C5 TaxID=497650 RepID=A0A0S4XPY4_9BACT|nr:DNA (cytosine-5-)-methyltransferase [Sulfurovum sp. enrichment culture clone C5]
MIKAMSSKKFKYIDIFSGCGGLALGLHNAGWQGLFAVEKSRDAFSTLKHNLIDNNNNFLWPEWLPKKNHDINEIIKLYEKNLIELQGKITLIAGGPPCQGFSMAGRRDETDQRNTLIDSYIKFVELVKPQILFFENVKGFTIGFKKGNQRGKAYSEYVVEKLTKLGYDVAGTIVDFSEYGVPQKRQRFILVGTLHGKANMFFDSIKENRADFFKSKNLTDKTSLSDAISDLLQANGTMESPDTKNFQAGIYNKPKSSYQKYMRQGKSLTNKIADSHRFAKHKLETVEKFKFILANAIPNKNISNDIREIYNLQKHTVVPLCELSCTPTLTTLPDDYIHYCEPRILTVREYARIQSFPDTYEFKGCYTTGGERRKVDVPRYTQIGNAIPPLFAEQAGIVLKGML